MFTKLIKFTCLSFYCLSLIGCGGGGSGGDDSNQDTVNGNTNGPVSSIDDEGSTSEPTDLVLADFPEDLDICTAVDGPENNVSIAGTISQLKKWSKSEITVAFLPNQGSQELRRTVMDLAGSWENPANIDFVEIDDQSFQSADIRIAFRQGKGNWSLIGTDSATAPRAIESMNLDLNDSDSEARIGRIALHEFGHALGMRHEHQNPAINIQWNKEVVYADLLRAEGWDRDTVDHNLFTGLDRNTTNFTEFDPQSIMLYPIPARWTLDGFETSWNTRLSTTDRQFIAEEYPFADTTPVLVRPVQKSFTSEASCKKGDFFGNPQCSTTQEYCAAASPNHVIDVGSIVVTKLAIFPNSGVGACTLTNSNVLKACISMHRASTGDLTQLNARHVVNCRIEFLERPAE